jgi:hypothetical protein
MRRHLGGRTSDDDARKATNVPGNTAPEAVGLRCDGDEVVRRSMAVVSFLATGTFVVAVAPAC